MSRSKKQKRAQSKNYNALKKIAYTKIQRSQVGAACVDCGLRQVGNRKEVHDNDAKCIKCGGRLSRTRAPDKSDEVECTPDYKRLLEVLRARCVVGQIIAESKK